MVEVAIWQLIFVLGWVLLGIFFLWSWRNSLTREKEMQDLFDMQWDADMRGIKMWQAAGEGRELKWPDSAHLVSWLLDQLHNPYPQKPTYTDYAGWLGLMSDKGGKGVVNNVDARALGRVANLILSLEDTVAAHRREEDMGWSRALECAAICVASSTCGSKKERIELVAKIRQMKEG